MKSKIIIVLTLFVSTLIFGQKSPARSVEGTIDEVNIKIEYSAPRVRERVIYGNLVPYNKVWRAGANENTTIEFDSDVKVEGERLAKGKYGFFLIPKENNKWVAIFSKKNDAWGSSSYSEEDDVLRVKLKSKDTGSNVENLSYVISDYGIFFSWADRMFEIKLK